MTNKIHFSLLPIILSLLFTTHIHGQLNLDYAFTLGSPESDFYSSFKVDQLGNYFMLVEYLDSTDLDPGPGQDLIVIDSSATTALVLSKFNVDGQYLQSSYFYAGKRIGGSIEELNNNQLLLVLYFTDSLAYVYQGNTSVLYNAPGHHVCFLRMNLNGEVVSQYTFDAPEYFYLNKLITLADGSYIVAGSFKDTFSFTPGGGGTSDHISRGGYDAFVAKLSVYLTPQWYKSFSSADDEYIEDIYVKDDEDIYFALTHVDTLLIPTSGGLKTFPANGEDNNVFGVISITGSVEKAFSFGGDLGDQVRSIKADAEGNIYICGYFEGEVNFENPSALPVVHTSVNESDGFVSKYTADGFLVWTRIIKDSQYGGIYTMNLERDNELYLSGSYSEIADLDPGPDSIIVNTSYRGDVFAIKLTTEGDLKWVYTFPGNDFEGIRQIVLSNQGKVYVSGYYFDSLDCDYTDGELIFQSLGGSDVFLMAFTEEGITIHTQDVINLETSINPNPALDKIHITCESTIDHISIFSLEGSELYVPVTLEGNSAEVSLHGISAGLYFVKTSSGERISVSKIVKQ